jgi:hypothetical protein
MSSTLALAAQRLPPVASAPSTDSAFPVTPDLLGSVNGMVNNAVATLGDFDYVRTDGVSQGALSLGSGGELNFNLTAAVEPEDSLYLYVVEAVNQKESFSGEVTVSNQSQDTSSELNTDLGTLGTAEDSTSLAISFDADDTAEQLYLQFVVGSEEFMESGGQLQNDLFNITLNGLNLALLSDGKTASFHNLVSTPYGEVHHPDFIHNPVNNGPASDQTPLDGYTQVLTFVGALLPNARNNLSINIRDVGDGLGDSAIFLGAGTLGTSTKTRGGLFIDEPRTLAEGEPGRALPIALDSVPTEDVTVTLTPDDQLDLGMGAGAPIALTFTRENALVPQSIEVTAFDDTIQEGPHAGAIAVQTESADPSYDALNVESLSISIRDNDLIPQIIPGDQPTVTADLDTDSNASTSFNRLREILTQPALAHADDLLRQDITLGQRSAFELSRESGNHAGLSPESLVGNEPEMLMEPNISGTYNLGLELTTGSTAMAHLFGNALSQLGTSEAHLPLLAQSKPELPTHEPSDFLTVALPTI